MDLMSYKTQKMFLIFKTRLGQHTLLCGNKLRSTSIHIKEFESHNQPRRKICIISVGFQNGQ